MGKLVAFQIHFDRQHAVYSAGDLISGYVQVDLTETKFLRGIYMQFVGRAMVSWTEIESRGKSKVTIPYMAGECYFDQNIQILGKEPCEENYDHQIPLETGDHRFPFEFQLPSRVLPCSFEGTLGYSRFFARAVIDRPWKFDHVTKRAFTISGVSVDLNKIPSGMSPVYAEDEKIVCCMCCATGPISVSAHTDKKCYVPGEVVYISANLENKSRRSVCTLEAELIQSVNYGARREGVGAPGFRTTSHVVKSISSEGCGSYSRATWVQKPLVIPPVPASGLEGCSFIDIKYYIKFTADVATTPFDVDLMLEITVGTEPLEGSFFARSVDGQNAMAIADIHIDLGKSVDDLHSYEQCAQGAHEIRDEEDNEYVYGGLGFTPLYNFYKTPTSTPMPPRHQYLDVVTSSPDKSTSV
ncbi:arrestin domain-containing protein 3 [Strongylocentrotus purpuratus]|uniref:Arrestin C-terminal-like domain-containing protein n=1 Tax=Strongylocentrotus purpuratus TaxID=7668 RepID=A0A7M7N9N2_STRPU|nr:arrestin domain-containing protein 3 [Strongylocentrotus purpuratus]